MLVIGISGQTGAGKSTLSKKICEKIKAEYIDVDTLGHRLLKDAKTIEHLIKAFGKDILTNSEIDRKKLGSKAFASAEATEKLNSIMHPRMVDFVKEIINDSRELNREYVVVDAALLYKMKLNALCNVIIYVKADPEIRFSRLVATRGWTEQRARERLFSQDQEPNGDNNIIVIENNGTKQDFEKSINQTISKIIEF